MATWFKFWASAREDSKLRSLNDEEFRYWVLLLCLNCEHGGSVPLADKEDVCIDVGLVDEEGEPCVAGLEKMLEKMVRRRLVTITDDVLTFNGWERRQGKPSERPDAVRERVARHRERHRNADVTPPVTPTEAEVEVDTERERAVRAKHGVFPQCMSEEWSVDGDAFTPGLARIISVAERKVARPLSTQESALIGGALTARCPDGCTGNVNTTCAADLIAKLRKTSIKAACDYYVRDYGRGD